MLQFQKNLINKIKFLKRNKNKVFLGTDPKNTFLIKLAIKNNKNWVFLRSVPKNTQKLRKSWLSTNFFLYFCNYFFSLFSLQNNNMFTTQAFQFKIYSYPSQFPQLASTRMLFLSSYNISHIIFQSIFVLSIYTLTLLL